jgi:hypothetical protein
MLTLRHASACVLFLSCASAAIAQDAKKSDPSDDKNSVVIPIGSDNSQTQGCKPPKLTNTSHWPALFRRNAVASISIGEFPMLKNDCVDIPSQFDVANHQAVSVRTLRYEKDECTVTLSSVTPIKKDDIGKEVSAIFTAPIIGGLVHASSKGDLPGTVADNTSLPPLKDASVTVTIKCTRQNIPDVGPPSQPQTFTLNYHDPTPVTGSAGAWISTLGKKTYGINTAPTGAISPTDGTAVTTSTIAVTSTSRVQFVPAGFINAYLTGTRTFNLNLEAGLGINPNGSSTQVEYFLGPAISWHNLYFSPGVHIAQAEKLTNGFSVNQTVSSGLTLPTGWYTTYKLAFAISYRTPPS